jgi:hypothetical protein
VAFVQLVEVFSQRLYQHWGQCHLERLVVLSVHDERTAGIAVLVEEQVAQLKLLRLTGPAAGQCGKQNGRDVPLDVAAAHDGVSFPRPRQRAASCRRAMY